MPMLSLTNGLPMLNLTNFECLVVLSVRYRLNVFVISVLRVKSRSNVLLLWYTDRV